MHAGHILVGPVDGLHAVTWLAWAVAAAACVQLAPNPLYVALVLASIMWSGYLVVTAIGAISVR